MNAVSKRWIYTSCAIAVLATSASLWGLFNPAAYAGETASWAVQAKGQDIGNLLAAIVFLISTYFLKNKSMRAFAVWVGALLYFIYAYIIYAFFVHFNYLFLVYVAVLGLCTFTLIGGLLEQSLNRIAIPSAHRPTVMASMILIGIGVLFGLLWLSEIIPALMAGHVPPSVSAAGMWVNPVHVIDLSVVLPGMVVTGILLRMRRVAGRAFVVPWLSFSVLMGFSIVMTSVLEMEKGNSRALVPLAVVGAVVLASLAALVRYSLPDS